MKLKIVDSKKINKLGAALAILSVLLITFFAMAMLIKILVPAFGELGLTKDFMLGPTGKMSLSTEFWYKGIPYRFDLIANIYLLIICPTLLALWAILGTILIFKRKTKLVGIEIKENTFEDNKKVDQNKDK